MAPDEDTLRQIELEQKRKLKRKALNAEIIEQARVEYLMTKELSLIELLKMH